MDILITMRLRGHFLRIKSTTANVMARPRRPDGGADEADKVAAELNGRSGCRLARDRLPGSGCPPHEDLSHTWGDGWDLSPSEMYAACVGISGYVPLPLTGNDYIELLPTVFRTVNDYGLTSTTELTSASSTAPPPNPAPSTLAPS
jgi:hypothetical protein